MKLLASWTGICPARASWSPTRGRAMGASSRPGSGGTVTVIDLGENVGFGRACNRAVSAHRSAAALLNPDITLIDGSLAEPAAEVGRRDRPTRLPRPACSWRTGPARARSSRRPTSVWDLIRAAAPPAAPPRSLSLPLAPW